MKGNATSSVPVRSAGARIYSALMLYILKLVFPLGNIKTNLDKRTSAFRCLTCQVAKISQAAQTNSTENTVLPKKLLLPIHCAGGPVRAFSFGEWYTFFVGGFQ